MINILHELIALEDTPVDWGTLFAPVATGVQGAITSALPVAIPVLVTLAAITIVLAVFRKVGVRR